MEPETKSLEAKPRRRRRRRKPKSMVGRASDLVSGRQPLFAGRKKKSSRKKSKSIGEFSAFETKLNKTTKSISRAFSPISKAVSSAFNLLRRNWWVQFSLGVCLGLMMLSLIVGAFLFFFTNVW